MVNGHNFIDTVQVEKANAIARYKRFRKLAKLLQVFKLVMVLTFLFLLWWSSRLRTTFKSVKISGKYVVEISLYVLDPHIIFLIGNAIVVALFLLYRHTDAENSFDVSISYDGYVNESERRLLIATAESTPLAEEIIGEEQKQIVCEEVISETQSTPVQEEPKQRDSTPIQEPKHRDKFERTMSEKLHRDVFSKSKKELQRSDTEVQRVVVTSDGRRMSRKTSTLETVDTLSSEEFRLTVEAFIQKQQKFLRQQNLWPGDPYTETPCSDLEFDP